MKTSVQNQRRANSSTQQRTGARLHGRRSEVSCDSGDDILPWGILPREMIDIILQDELCIISADFAVIIHIRGGFLRVCEAVRLARERVDIRLKHELCVICADLAVAGDIAGNYFSGLRFP